MSVPGEVRGSFLKVLAPSWTREENLGDVVWPGNSILRSEWDSILGNCREGRSLLLNVGTWNTSARYGEKARSYNLLVVDDEVELRYFVQVEDLADKTTVVRELRGKQA